MSRAGLALLSGLAYGLAAPDLRGAVAVIAGSWCAGRALSGRLLHDVALGVLAGLAWFVVALAWVPAALADHGVHGVRWATALLVLVQAVTSALPWAIASPLVRRIGPGLALALGWLIATEPLAALQPLPCPPALLLSGSVIALWPAAIGGTPLLSAIAVGVGAGLPSPWAGAVLGAWVWLGSLWLAQPEPRAATHVGIVQPDLGAFDARRSSTAADRRERVVSLLRAADAQGADWLATPEGAWPGDVRDAVEALSSLPPTVLGLTAGRRNRLVVVADGGVGDVFDKVILTPATERRVLGVGDDVFEPGDRPRHLDVGGLRLGPLVCFEDAHPSALRAAVAGDPGVLLAAANDAWTSDGPGTDWHLGAARLAAVVTGRPVVRPTTSGRSAAIDPGGRLTWSTPWVDGDQPGARGTYAVVEVHPAHPRVAGVVVGPWLGGLGVLLALAGLRRPVTDPASPPRRRSSLG